MLDPKVLVALDYQHEADAFAFIERISRPSAVSR